MFLLAPFILQNFKKILRANPELWECAIFGSKMAHLSWTNYFWYKTIIITFIYLLAFFIVQNFKKFLQRIQSYEDPPFFGPKWSICPKQISFLENYWYHSHLHIGPFHCANFKKTLPVDPELWGCAMFIPKTAHFRKWDFFSEKLLLSLVPVIHAYLHAKNQSQILICYCNIDD